MLKLPTGNGVLKASEERPRRVTMRTTSQKKRTRMMTTSAALYLCLNQRMKTPTGNRKRG